MTSWVCQCGHDPQAHDRLHPEGGPVVYPCTLCPCTNMTSADTGPAPQLHPKGDAARIARLHGLGLILTAAADHLVSLLGEDITAARDACAVLVKALDPYDRDPYELIHQAVATHRAVTVTLVDDAAMERLARFLFDQDPPAQTPPRHLRAVPPPADGA